VRIAYDDAMTTPPFSIAHRSPFDDAMPTTQILFGFRGRVPRRTFWLYGVLGPLLVSMLGEMLLGIVGIAERRADGLMSLLLIWPCAAVGAKRWHDRDKSGWWTLIILVPFIGAIWFIVECGILEGTKGANRYGPDPLA